MRTASARPLAAEPIADAANSDMAAPTAVETATAVDRRVLLVLGGVASVPFLLLVQLVQTRFARLSRAPDAPPTGD